MNNYSIYKSLYIKDIKESTNQLKKKGLSLQKLAEKAGVATNLIYSQKKKKHPSKTNLKKLLMF